jgi:hypothetical protein
MIDEYVIVPNKSMMNRGATRANSTALVPAIACLEFLDLLMSAFKNCMANSIGRFYFSLFMRDRPNIWI